MKCLSEKQIVTI